MIGNDIGVGLGSMQATDGCPALPRSSGSLVAYVLEYGFDASGPWAQSDIDVSDEAAKQVQQKLFHHCWLCRRLHSPSCCVGLLWSMLHVPNNFNFQRTNSCWAPITMPLKRKAEDALPENSLPSKRPFIQHNPEQAYAGPAVPNVVMPPPTSPMEADLALAGTADQQEDQSEQHEVPLSSCTDLVVYRPPPMLDPSIAAATSANTPLLPLVVLHNGQTVDLQQPNGMALVLRSLTPEQRASLRGIWDQLRDQKMLQNMLRKLPSPDQHQHGNGTVDASRSSEAAGNQPAAPCTIEELHPDQNGSSDDSDAVPTAVPAAVMPPAAVAAAGPGWGLNGSQQVNGVVPHLQHPAVAANGGFISATSQLPLPQSAAATAALPQWQQIGQPALQPQWQQTLQQQQQQQQQETLWPNGSNDAMMLDAAAAGQQQQQLQAQGNADRGPMDMDMS